MRGHSKLRSGRYEEDQNGGSWRRHSINHNAGNFYLKRATTTSQYCWVREPLFSLRDVIYHPMERKLHLIFEFVEMDLKKYLTKHMMTPTTIKYIMNQIVTGLDYCHSKRIIHRDIKPQNVLINKDLTVKIADFGLSRTFGLPMRTLTH